MPDNKKPIGADKIVVKGARTHNLKNISVEIPRNKMVVFTGLSGSGKIAVGTNIIDALVAAKLSSSKREARQFLEDNAVDLNGTVITDPKRELVGDDFYNGIALLKRGKRNITVLTLA